MPGVNVGRVGLTFAPSAIAESGAPSIRCTYHPDSPLNLSREWLESLHAHGITVLMLLDNDTHFWGAPQQWKDGIARARNAYGDLVDLWQVCNEPDAGWFPGTTETIEERAAAHPSSWVMTQSELEDRLLVARQVLGQRALIIGPGLVSGHPEWAADMDWTQVDMIACHPYAKAAGSPELMGLLAAYSAFGWPVVVSEYDATTPGMHTWMERNMGRSWAFCWSDEMVNGFGLIERPAAYEEFLAANAATVPPGGPIVALPIPVFKSMWQAHLPAAEFHEGFGIEKFWMDNYKALGAVTSLVEYREGSKAWRTFVGGVVEWTDGQGAKIA